MKIQVKVDDQWQEINDEDNIILKRAKTSWIDMNKKKQRPSKKIQGGWYKMGEVGTKC